MSFCLRKAIKSDCELLFQWTNEREVRQNSFNVEKVLYEDHCKWFENKLESDTSDIFIGVNCGEDIGQVRIDRCEDSVILSYSIDFNHRGKGFGYKLLKSLEEEIKIRKDNIAIMIGFVKYENNASRRIFEMLGYKKNEHEDKIEYIKNIN